MKITVKKILLFVLLGFIAGLAIVIILFNKPHKSIAKTKAEITIEAGDLMKAFQQDELLANEKYLGKIIEVSGVVTGISKGMDGSVSITLADFMTGVTCTINAEDAYKHKDLIEGVEQNNTIRLKGRCDGILTDIRLSDCVFIE